MNQQELILPAALFERDAFNAALDQAGHLDCCKDQVQIVDQWLHQQFRDGAPITTLIRLRARFIDELLGVLWDRHDWGSAGVSLVAVGGYGRGELHPHSDIDILLLIDEANAPAEDVLSGFVTLLWDLGLQIGHSVRTVAECEAKAREDITILTNLMEARTLRGETPSVRALDAHRSLQQLRRDLIQRNANPQMVAERLLLGLRDAVT